MKNFFLILLGIFCVGLLPAQVGINTKNPLGVFHVDGQSNTNASGTVNVGDDVVINSNGNIGIGQLPRSDVKINLSDGGTPTGIKPVFQLQDGNEGVGRVLVSDASGNATWKEFLDFGLTIGKFGTGVYFSADPDISNATYGVTPRTNNNGVKTTGEIVLGKGLWWVRCSFYVSSIANGEVGKQVWVRSTLADDASFPVVGGMNMQFSKDLLINHTLASTMVWCNGAAGVVQGSFILDNRSMTTATKKYYLLVGWTHTGYNAPAADPTTIYRTGLSSSGENSLFAYRIEG